MTFEHRGKVASGRMRQDDVERGRGEERGDEPGYSTSRFGLVRLAESKHGKLMDMRLLLAEGGGGTPA